jgi:hypothetical protein
MITIIQTKNGVSALWAPTPNHSFIAPAKPLAKQNRLLVRWHALTDYLVPIGYEDETGFHYGEKPGRADGR